MPRFVKLLALISVFGAALYPLYSVPPKQTVIHALPGAAVGGRTAPDGKTEIHCDLPGDMHQHNIASQRLGCCVFRSIDHAARWQNVPALQQFPEWMVQKHIEGGGYPQKVENLIPKIAADRGLAVPEFIQVEGKDLDILKKACASGRMPGVTYGRSPTGRYGGMHIDHMVSLPHADDTYFAVLDNNYIGENNYEWMTPQEFLKAYTDGSSSGWAVILLAPPPPPPPKNFGE